MSRLKLHLVASMSQARRRILVMRWLEMMGWRRWQRGWFGPILVRLCSPAALAIFVPRSTAWWGCWIFWSLCDQISSSSTLLAFSNESHTLSSCFWGFCSSNLRKLNLAILIEAFLPLSCAISSPVLSFLALVLANVDGNCYYMLGMMNFWVCCDPRQM